jgi:hypothetical protein
LCLPAKGTHKGCPYSSTGIGATGRSRIAGSASKVRPSPTRTTVCRSGCRCSRAAARDLEQAEQREQAALDRLPHSRAELQRALDDLGQRAADTAP